MMRQFIQEMSLYMANRNKVAAPFLAPVPYSHSHTINDKKNTNTNKLLTATQHLLSQCINGSKHKRAYRTVFSIKIKFHYQIFSIPFVPILSEEFQDI